MKRGKGKLFDPKMPIGKRVRNGLLAAAAFWVGYQLTRPKEPGSIANVFIGPKQ